MGKTGSNGRPWVVLPPKPPRVENRYDYWETEPPELSERCKYWRLQLLHGWYPNKHLRQECYDCRAEWFGVYLWEYLHILYPIIVAKSEVRT